MELSQYPVCATCKRPLVPYTAKPGLACAPTVDVKGHVSGTFVCHSALCGKYDLVIRVGP